MLIQLFSTNKLSLEWFCSGLYPRKTSQYNALVHNQSTVNKSAVNHILIISWYTNFPYYYQVISWLVVFMVLLEKKTCLGYIMKEPWATPDRATP